MEPVDFLTFYMPPKKREVPPMIRNILDFDERLTKLFVSCTEQWLPLRELKIHYTVLEISCHGIPWLTCLIAFIWILNNRSLYQMQINLLIGLLLDIVVIAFLKAITRRRRPAIDPIAVGPDVYSFPSGHASRSMLVLYFFVYLWPISPIFLLPLLAWVFAVAMSRLLMRKHHILDICVGLLVGYVEGMLMSLLYLNARTCISLVSWITDEKMDGADYDV